MHENQVTESTCALFLTCSAGTHMFMFQPWKNIIGRSRYSNVMCTSKTSGRQLAGINRGDFHHDCRSSNANPPSSDPLCTAAIVTYSPLMSAKDPLKPRGLNWAHLSLSVIGLQYLPVTLSQGMAAIFGRAASIRLLDYNTHLSLLVCRLKKKQNVRK